MFSDALVAGPYTQESKEGNVVPSPPGSISVNLRPSDQPAEHTPSTTTTTLPTPDATRVQFAGVECHNPPRFIFYPISWDEPDGLIVSEIDQRFCDLNITAEQLAILHDELADPLSPVCWGDDPFDSIDRWRRNVVDCGSPCFGPFETIVDPASSLGPGSLLDEDRPSGNSPTETSVSVWYSSQGWTPDRSTPAQI
ncbi:hypothetical protein V8B97DRAFT_370649 [Scleroderma yunnanense]